MRRIDLFLPHLAHAPALRTLIISCSVCHPYGKFAPPNREALHRLLAVAPQLHVRLGMAPNERWHRDNLIVNGTCAISSADCSRMDEQWRKLQRMAAEMERVTIVDS